MPRVRALVLLGLFLVNQAACTSWQVPKVTPQEYVAQHPDKKVRVTQKDQHGGWSTDAGVVLTGVRFSGDSVFGRDKKGQPVAFSLQQLAVVEVRATDGMLTGLAVLGIGAVATLVVGAIGAVSQDP
jgi:hypothetical protein